MILGAALQGVERLYVDTAPFIDYIEASPTYIARMDQIVARIKQIPIQGFCSVVTLTKVLPVPLKTGKTALVQAYRDMLLNSQEFECRSLDRGTAASVSELRALVLDELELEPPQSETT